MKQKTIAQLNNEAQGLAAKALALNERAYELQKEAAMRLAYMPDKEPTRSILFKSTAVLALRCGDVFDARYMALVALEGNPPVELAEEFREILKVCEIYEQET